jgi:prolyl-tRNA synthetase
MVFTGAGEDFVVYEPKSGYAANLEKAVSRPKPPAQPDPEGDLSPEEVHTPGKKTIAEVADFLGLPETSLIKSVVVVAGGEMILVLLRGDHTVSETKLAAVLGASELRPAHPAEIRERFGADPGSLGPVGLTGIRIVADEALRCRRNMVSGANRDDYHLRHVTPGEDFHAEYYDLRQVAPGDTHVDTGAPLEIHKAVEIGHIFKLGYRYSESMGLRVLNEEGKEVTPIMGSYGIGVERILCAAIELFHDHDGIVLPASIAPFEVVITPVKWADPQLREAAERLHSECRKLGLDVLLDDRDDSPGVKFKDADLIGIPWRITVGKKLADGMVEIIQRRGRKVTDVPVAEAAGFVAARVRSGRANGR